ncbi:MAG: 4,5-DOPA dioxygenase extradiol [Candidatus Saccharibacteria bacterium]
MKLSEFNKMTSTLGNTDQMPVLFIGHGSPMNAIEENEFVNNWRVLGQTLPRPHAILVISAHWETSGTQVTAMERPRTIHDFGGFPQALFAVQYPAPGSPELAHEVKSIVKSADILLDQKWGLDHGAWSIINRLYPNADIPVVQMSLDYYQTPGYHYNLAKELASLRHKGVLIIGSGNMVHNLRMVAWDKLNADAYGYDWALEANEKMKQFILKGDHQSMINFRAQGRAFDLAIPSAEHFIPSLYALGLKEENEKIDFFNDKAVAGSLTMTSFKIG